MTSTLAPSNRGRKGGGKGGGRRTEANKIYAHPLPILFAESSVVSRTLRSVLGLSVTEIINPHVHGYLDPATKSVWITNSTESMILWRRGFFGKGDLSRSEPSWLARQINDQTARKTNRMTSEQVTAKRRADRKQFKLDRAKAIAMAAAEAEQAFEVEGKVVTPALSGPNIPSAATWRPSPEAEPDEQPLTQLDSHPGEADDEPIEDVEHLQLSFPEAFFLIWHLDCLTILDPLTDEPLTLAQIWETFQRIHLQSFCLSLSSLQYDTSLQLDNPFLVNFIVYNHYRSLGWVVKGGIKFCVDFLLYKRGPVFSHAEFALVVCPAYEDSSDQKLSPFNYPNAKPFEWSWLSTINRVNSQVMKTLILVYVTIPARSRTPMSVLHTPACLKEYSIREVTVRRFIPARMRD
ncbi:tRNA-intron endonuclease [Flagelloscypha sp. PMI_526]|nr:tRNA-intron endonuclease [Flagelloscypha sp. PMI_526]